MSFTSTPFFLLLAVTLALYYAPALARLQRFTLIAASLVFYGAHQPGLLALLLASIAINVAASYAAAIGTPARRLTAASLGVAANLGILATFKYGPLFVRSAGLAGTALGDALLAIPLPIGISFFTFQGISLVVDAYRGDAGIGRPFAKHATDATLFLSFFAHVVAGPIVKARELLPQIRPKRWSGANLDGACHALVTGYFLKTVVADNLSALTIAIDVEHHVRYSTGTLAALLFGYSMQIFADFAGYSLIAIGLAHLFGYQFPQNFRFPYLATSFAGFWRRWHISLSTFLRDYLYVPLGGNRRGRRRSYVNLFLVMFLGGLWHGAAWSYAIWGAYHGALLALERRASERWPTASGFPVLRGAGVFALVTLGWLLFRLPDHRHAASFLRALYDNTGLAPDHSLIYEIALFSAPVVAYHLQHLVRGGRPVPRPVHACLLAAMLFLVVLNRAPAAPFIYFQF